MPPRLVIVCLALLAGPALAQGPANKYALDADRLFLQAVEDDAPVRGEDENPQEFDAYNAVLLHARQFPAAELEAAAERGVSFRDLVAPVRRDFRYKLVYFEGRLARLRKLTPTKPLAEAGVTALYEGWVFPAVGGDPLCVLVTDPPPGVEPVGDLPRPVPVAVAGYSFKLIRYESRAADPKHPDRNVVRRAPLLMARGFTRLPEPEPGQPWRTGFAPGVAALVGGIIAVGLGLTVWFRRGDRAARRAVASRRENPFTAGD
ncbi:MAG: hypothetical protein U0871_12645 [Gemmataceae bacterium]